MSNRDQGGGSTPDSWTIEDHLRGKPSTMIALFERFLAAAQSHRCLDVQPQKDVVVLRDSRRILAGVRLTPHGLRGHLNLPRQIDDPRFTKVEPLTKRLFFHRFVIRSLSELDDEFLGWVREACAIESNGNLESGRPATDGRLP